MAKAKNAVPAGHHTITPHFTMSHAAQAIDWYQQAFGAQEVARAVGPGGQIMHAELRIGDSLIMLNDVMGGTSGTAVGSPLAMWVYVEDCDVLFNRAIAAGAKVPPGPMGQLADQFWGDRCGTLIDPYGFQWTIASRKEDLTPEEIDRRMTEFMASFASTRA